MILSTRLGLTSKTRRNLDMQAFPNAKVIKHKPTMPPLQCDHCGKIWYGMVCNSETHRIVPRSKILCVNCWSDLDNHLYKHREYQVVTSYIGEDDAEWKNGYPEFFEAAIKWIQAASKRRKTVYSHVPK